MEGQRGRLGELPEAAFRPRSDPCRPQGLKADERRGRRATSVRGRGPARRGSRRARPRNSVHLHAGLQDRGRHRVHLTGGLLPIPGVFGSLWRPGGPSLPSSCAPERGGGLRLRARRSRAASRQATVQILCVEVLRHSLGRSGSPAHERRWFVRRLRSPTHELRSLAHRLRSPTHELRSLVHQLPSHAHELRSFVHQLRSHAHELRSFVHQLRSHAHELRSLVHQLRSPAHELRSFVHQLRSPAHELRSFVHQLRSPAHELRSFVHQLRS
jgi:hypothetical protein